MQRAINNLAQSGAQLEAGDVKAAAGTLRCEESLGAVGTSCCCVSKIGPEQ